MTAACRFLLIILTFLAVACKKEPEKLADYSDLWNKCMEDAVEKYHRALLTKHTTWADYKATRPETASKSSDPGESVIDMVDDTVMMLHTIISRNTAHFR